MVPKQCPFRRPTFWHLVCCATCLGSRDNSKYHSQSHTVYTYIPTYIPTWPKSDFHRLFDSGLAPSALSLRLNQMFVFVPIGITPTIFLSYRHTHIRQNRKSYGSRHATRFTVANTNIVWLHSWRSLAQIGNTRRARFWVRRQNIPGLFIQSKCYFTAE